MTSKFERGFFVSGSSGVTEERGDEKRPPQEWAALDGLRILDPDGWRGKDDPPFDEPTTYADYRRRMWVSTVGPLQPTIGWSS